MSGVVICFGECIACHKRLSFNPVKVPSVRHPETGEKEPLCESCFNRWNEIHRTSKGLAPLPLPEGAYGSCDETELV